MTTAVKVPFADASPAELREAILPEDRDQFDRSYRTALNAAAETLRLDELESFLAHWRRLAWCQTDAGHDTWRAMLAKADRILATGEPPPGAVSQEEMEQRLAARLANRQMYRITIDPDAMEQIDALPFTAALGYAEALGVMKLVPWSGPSLNGANPEGQVRQLIFGPGGYGTVTYLILENQQRVDVLLVQWAG